MTKRKRGAPRVRYSSEAERFEQQRLVRRLYMRHWYRAHRDHVREYARLYRLRNREKIRTYNRLWWQLHRHRTAKRHSLQSSLRYYNGQLKRLEQQIQKRDRELAALNHRNELLEEWLRLNEPSSVKSNVPARYPGVY